MSPLVDPLLVLVLLMNFLVLGTSRLRAAINASAVQGALLGLITVAVDGWTDLRALVVAAFAIGLKAVLIPGMLGRALRETAIKREIEPFIGYVNSLLLCSATTGAAVLFASELPLAPEHVGSLMVPASLATVLAGFLVLTTRLKAITQVVGYLMLENGIFIMGLTLHGVMPMLVEIGVLLDLLVAIFVIGIVINHINRAFSSIDVSRLDTLKE